jgi:hypothetical protein
MRNKYNIYNKHPLLAFIILPISCAEAPALSFGTAA